MVLGYLTDVLRISQVFQKYILPPNIKQKNELNKNPKLTKYQLIFAIVVFYFVKNTKKKKNNIVVP